MGDPELDLRRNLATGQFDRMQRIEAALLAKEMGLDPTEYAQPFPGNSSITINHTAPTAATSPPASSFARTVTAALLAGGLGAGGALLAAPWLSTLFAARTTERVVEKIITQPGSDYGVQVDMQVIPPVK